MDTTHALGQAIKWHRTKLALSQETMGTSQSYVSDIERGLKSLSVEKLEEFADAMGVHPLSILTKCYLLKNSSISLEDLFDRVANEIQD